MVVENSLATDFSGYRSSPLPQRKNPGQTHLDFHSTVALARCSGSRVPEQPF